MPGEWCEAAEEQQEVKWQLRLKYSESKPGANTDILDITARVSGIVRNSGLTDGIVTVIIQGSTAAITTIKNESRLLADLKDSMEKVVPTHTHYRHPANAFAHIRSALFGTSFTVPFADRLLKLGIWQQIVSIDFDNRPRSREIIVQIV